MNQTIKALIVVLVSVAGAASCGYLLYADFTQVNSDVSGLLKAGKVRIALEKVKRKYGESMIWDPISSADHLYWDDAIQTAKDAKVEIALDDGNVITLGESSLVVLERDNNQLSLSLRSGELFLSHDNNENSEHKDEKLKINGVVISKNEDSSLSLKVDKKNDKLVATTTEGDGTGKLITIDKAGKVEEKKLPVLLQSPPPLSHFYSDSRKHDVNFKWQAQKGEFIFQVSKTTSFGNPYYEKELDDLDIEKSFPEGNYYWRVIQAEGKKDLDSEVRKFSITRVAEPEPLAPASKKKFVYKGEIPTIEFRWTEKAKPEKYLFEVATDDDFENIVFTDSTTHNYYRSSHLKEGRLYWRVTSFFPGIKKTSDESSITLKENHQTDPPHLVAPIDEFKVTMDFFEKAQGIPFKWESAFVENHRFVLSDSSSLKNELIAFETEQNDTLITKALPVGTYYWSIGHKNMDGKWVYPEKRRLEVGPLAPLLAAPSLLTPAPNTELDLMDNTLVTWQWKQVQGAKEYKFRLYKIENNKESLVFEDTLDELTKQKNDLPDGDYKWSVSALDEYGRESKVANNNMSVRHGYTLEAPTFEMEEVH